jgi:hypothetical protein
MSDESTENNQDQHANSQSTPAADNIVANTLKNFDYLKVIARLKAVVFSPKTIWGEVQQEGASLKELYLSYYLPLSIIAAICIYIGKVSRTNVIFWTFIGTVVQLAVMLATLWVVAKVMEFLAPKFNGTAPFLDSARLFCFSMLPGLAIHVFQIFPSPLAHLIQVIGGLYGIYIFWTGAPHMIQIPADRRNGFLISVILLTGLAIGMLILVLGSIFPHVGSHAILSKAPDMTYLPFVSGSLA